MRYKLYTNVLDFTGNRTVPSMDNSNAARVPSPTVLYRIRVLVVKYEYSYCKVQYYTYRTTVLNLLLYVTYSSSVSATVLYLLPTTVPTTYYSTYYLLLPNTCYQATTYSTVLYYLLPTAYCLLPATY